MLPDIAEFNFVAEHLKIKLQSFSEKRNILKNVLYPYKCMGIEI